MDSTEKESPKKPYVSPVLTIYGSVHDLTRSNRKVGAVDHVGRIPTRTAAD